MKNIQAATRLRYIRGKNKNLIVNLVSSLNFKIEIKSITEEAGVSTIWFVIPDNVKDFKNKDLTDLE